MHPFEIFGRGHLIAMLVLVLVTVFLPLAVRMLLDKRASKRLAAVLGFALLVLKCVEPFYLVASGRPWVDSLPLHLCDFGAVLTGIMLINQNYFFYELIYFWGLGGTLQAIITPSLQWDFPHADFWLYFVSHGLIIVGAIYATVVFGFRPTMQSVFRAVKWLLLLAIFIAPVNYFLNSNYLYLCEKPPASSLMDFFGPWPWYLLFLIPFSMLMFLVYYAPFWLFDRTKTLKAR